MNKITYEKKKYARIKLTAWRWASIEFLPAALLWPTP